MSQKAEVVARARVVVTVEIPLPDKWGADCSLDQIQKQAKDGAENALRNGLVLSYLQCGRDPKTEATIVGEPRVTAILVDEKR